MCSTYPNFSLKLWCKLVVQSVITPNLLRPSLINPNLSVHAKIFGNFNYECTPMDPPGIKVLLRGCGKDCGLWSLHVLSRWYIFPSLERYHCHQIWIPATNSVCIGKTVSCFPHKLTMPTDTATDIIIATAKYLTAALKQPPQKTSTYAIQYHHTQSTLSAQFHFLQCLVCTKITTINLFKLPRVSTPKPVAAPPRVSPCTTQDLPYNTKSSQRYFI